MKRSEFLNEIEMAIELPPNTLTGHEALADIPTWDSLAVIMVIALIDEKLGMMVEGEALANAQTMDDVLALIKTGLEA